MHSEDNRSAKVNIYGIKLPFYLEHLLLSPVDINECSPFNPTHNCDQICNNTDGGFDCSCEEGYLLANDSKSCEGMYRDCIGCCFQYLNVQSLNRESCL